MLVVNKRNHTPTPSDVYVGRPSPLGNPHIVGYCRICKHQHKQGEAVDLYRYWLHDQLMHGNHVVIDALETIPEDATLVCWCAPKPCHADVIIRARAWWDSLS